MRHMCAQQLTPEASLSLKLLNYRCKRPVSRKTKITRTVCNEPQSVMALQCLQGQHWKVRCVHNHMTSQYSEEPIVQNWGGGQVGLYSCNYNKCENSFWAWFMANICNSWVHETKIGKKFNVFSVRSTCKITSDYFIIKMFKSGDNIKLKTCT